MCCHHPRQSLYRVCSAEPAREMSVDVLVLCVTLFCVCEILFSGQAIQLHFLLPRSACCIRREYIATSFFKTHQRDVDCTRTGLGDMLRRLRLVNNFPGKLWEVVHMTANMRVFQYSSAWFA